MIPPRQRRGLSTGRLATALAVGGLLLCAVPLVALVLGTPWPRVPALLTRPAAVQALRLSVVTSAAAVALSMTLGIPLAWVLARSAVPGLRVVRAAVTLPMVLPPVVAGVALLEAFGRAGLAGGLLTAGGLNLPFSTAGAALAQAFVAAPFLIVTAEAGFLDADRRLEEAAAALGAGRVRVWWTVVLPAARPALLAGVALCWARALGEFGATITFAGNLAGRTQTLPLAVYETLQTDPDAALALSLLLLAVSLALLLGLRGRWGRARW